MGHNILETPVLILQGLEPLELAYYSDVDAAAQFHGYGKYVSNEQYRELATQAETDPSAQEAFEKSHVSLKDDPTDAIDVIREHPVIHQALDDPEEDKAVYFVSPYRSFRVELKTLALGLTKLAIKTNGLNAAKSLHSFLTLGEARELKGYEVTLYYGLKLDRHLDIAPGAFLAPYEDVKDIYGSIPALELEYLHKAIQPTHPLDEAPQSIAALVRELAWGPAITSASEKLESSLTVTFSYSIEDEPVQDTSSTYRFSRDHETVRDFLSIASGNNQIAPLQYIRADKWMEAFDPNVKHGWSSGRSRRNDWWQENKLSENDAAIFLEMLEGWRGYLGDRDRLGLALRRLAVLPSRTGRFGVEDRILDAAIALESMYSLDAPEITYKLGTRAGYFLGTNAKERIEIFDKVKKFYGARSALVHGSGRERRRIDVWEALSQGLHLARETLLKLLRDGKTPDWDSFVMSAGGNS